MQLGGYTEKAIDILDIVYNLRLLFPCYCLCFKTVGLGFDGFFLVVDLRLLFPCYFLLFKAVGFRLS